MAKLTRLTNKILIQLHLVAESFTICSSRSGQPVPKLLDTHSYVLDITGLYCGRCTGYFGVIFIVFLSHSGQILTPVPLNRVCTTISL